jgi:type II secretory pathway component PulK
MVMVMVLMAIAVMMVFSIGVISRGVSQTKSSEQQIDRIKAEQLAMGAYAKAYSDMAVGGAMPTTFTATLDNKTYNATITTLTGGTNNTNVMTISTAPF